MLMNLMKTTACPHHFAALDWVGFGRVMVLVPLILLAAMPTSIRAGVSTFLVPFHLNRSAEILPLLKEAGVTTIAFPIVWAESEPREGVFDFTEYHGHLDRIVAEGMDLILILDFSGRMHLDPITGAPDFSSTSMPKWVLAEHLDKLARDHRDRRVQELDHTNPGAVELVSPFLEQAIGYFNARYGDRVRGFAIGAESELEIKYGQLEYIWRNYSRSAKDAYAAWSGNDPMPIIEFNNNIVTGHADAEKNFASFMRFRERQLSKFTCKIAAVMRASGARVHGYFGGQFTTHDAIYALGVIEDVVPCFDAITVDYNFSDGYQRINNPWFPVLLTNYAANLGYNKVFTGYYLERWQESGASGYYLDNRILSTVATSIDLLSQDGYSAGLEIGGVPINQDGDGFNREVAQLKALGIDRFGKIVETSPRAPPLRIGILASKTHFYLWHGERSFDRNIHTDALLEAFAMFFMDERFKPIVIGETTIRTRPDLMATLDGVYLPHQTTMEPEAERILMDYNATGLPLIQDLRFSEFSPDGAHQADWQSEGFGIALVDWKNQPQEFSYRQGRIKMLPQQNNYASHAVLYPRPGFSALAPAPDGKGGLMIRGPRTLALGFMPQLLESEDGQKARQIALDEIAALIDAR